MSTVSPLSRPARLDLTPLTKPVDDAAITAFAADAKATGKPWRRMTTGLPRPGVVDILGQLVPAAVPLVAITFFLYVGGWSLISAVWEFTVSTRFPLNLVIVGFVALILLAVLAAVFAGGPG